MVAPNYFGDFFSGLNRRFGGTPNQKLLYEKLKIYYILSFAILAIIMTIPLDLEGTNLARRRLLPPDQAILEGEVSRDYPLQNNQPADINLPV